MKAAWMIMAVMVLAGWSYAQHAINHATPHKPQAVAVHEPLMAHETDALPHPFPSSDPAWTGAVLAVVAGMFVAAMVVGPIVRRRIPREVPPMHSHDEPPGTSGHHDASGTITPHPGHGH